MLMAKIIRKTNEQIIKQTAKDMLRKNLINDQSKMFLKDPNMIKQAIKAYDTELIKEYSCPECGLTIKCPKKWIILHFQKCSQVHKRKENEIIQSKVNPYGYFTI
jgi:hypothetical protein